jgi:hypothetical protein
MANIASLNKSLSSIGSGKYSIESLNQKLGSIGSGLFTSPLKLGKFLGNSTSRMFGGVGVSNSEKNVPDLLKKLYNFMKKTREDDLRNRALENSFEEEERMEEARRHEALLDAIKTYTKVAPIEDTEEKESFFSKMKGWAGELLKSIGGLLSKLSAWSLGLLGAVGGFFTKFKSILGSILSTLAKNILKPLASLLIKKIIFGVFSKMLFGLLGRLVLGMSPWLLAIAGAVAAAAAISEYLSNQVDKFTESRALEQGASRFRGLETTAGPSTGLAARTINQNILKDIREKASGTKKGVEGQAAIGANRDFLDQFYPAALEPVDKGEKKLYNTPILGAPGVEIKLPFSDEESKEMSTLMDIIDGFTKQQIKTGPLGIQEKRENAEAKIKLLEITHKKITETYKKKNIVIAKEFDEIPGRISREKTVLQSIKNENPGTMSLSEMSADELDDRRMGRSMAELERNETFNTNAPVPENKTPTLRESYKLLQDVYQDSLIPETEPGSTFEMPPEQKSFTNNTVNGDSRVVSNDPIFSRNYGGTFALATRNNFASSVV